MTVFGPESSDEEAGALQDALDVFAAESGIEITYTGNRDAADMINTQVAGGNPPDIFVFPQPGKLADFARDGSVLPLPADVVSSMEWSDAWTSFGNVDGTQYGVPSKSDLKSLVWYKQAKFAEKGYEIPGSWDALKSLAGDMIANGDTPFCVGIESGPATGWTFTDWIEDLMLRMHGADLYDEWVAGTLAFSSPEVSGVFEEVLELWNTPGMVYASGGSIAATPFGDNGQPLVDDDCMMHRQASFYAAFIPEGTAFADGSPDAVDTFYFPSVKGDYPVLGAGTLVGAFRDAPEVWEVMKYFGSAAYAETRQIAQTERKGGGLSGFLSGASGQDPSVYQPLEQSFLNILVSADVVRFDASDLMPAAVGAGTFWTDGTAVVNGDKTVAEATADIDASWPGAAPASSGSSLGDGSLGTVEVGAGEDIQIRSLHAISGDVAFLGVPMSRAVDMAVADYGDIHGFSVNAGTWLDDLCSSDGGQAAAQTIVADESVIGVLGTSCSGAATAAAPLITGAGMVLISGSNTSPALTSDLAGTAGDNWSEGYYRTAHNDLYQGAAAAKFAYEVLGAASAATIHDGDPYTEGLATAFANSFSDLGGDLQTITAVNKGDTDMVPVLTEVAAGSPDLLFFPIFPPEGNFISQQIGEVAGLENTTLMAADGMLVDNYMEIPESEGVFMSGPDLNFEGNANAATGQTGDGFLAAYEAEHGEAPSAAFWAHAYDATTLLLSAIEAASSTDGDDLVVDRAGVREFMAGVADWPGIIGDISCDDFGDCGSQRIAVVQHNDSSDIAAGKNNVVFTYAPGGSATAGAIAAASGGSSASADDAVHGHGAEAWQDAILNPVGAADDSMDPIVWTMANLEGDPIGSFPEIREGLEIAVAQINNDFGGIGGRPVDVQVCVHGFDPAAAINCGNEIGQTNPHLNINGIEFFTPALWPTFIGAGIPTIQTVPIFVADFSVEGNGYSPYGGCPVAFPGAATYTVEEVGYKKIAVLYAGTGPGLECFGDTEERFWDYLQTEYEFDWKGFPDASGDPTDNDANIQAMAAWFEGSAVEDRAVFFGMQASDCNEMLNAITAAGLETAVVSSGSCVDESVLSNPAAAGSYFEHQSYIAERPDLYDAYSAWELGQRESLLDSSPLRTAPVSSFLRVGYGAGAIAYQVLTDLVESGGDIEDRASIIAAFGGMENQHAVGQGPVTCTDNTSEYPSVCKKTLTFVKWTGTEWELGDFGGKIINVGDIQNRVAAGNPRQG